MKSIRLSMRNKIISSVLILLILFTQLSPVMETLLAGDIANSTFNPLDGVKWPEVREAEPDKPGQSLKYIDSEITLSSKNGAGISNKAHYSGGNILGYNAAWDAGPVRFSTLAGAEYYGQVFTGTRDGQPAAGASGYGFIGLRARQTLKLDDIKYGDWNIKPKVSFQEMLGAEALGETYVTAGLNGVRWCNRLNAFAGGKLSSNMSLDFTSKDGAGVVFGCSPYVSYGLGLNMGFDAGIGWDGLKLKLDWGVTAGLGAGMSFNVNIKFGKYGNMMKEAFYDTLRKSLQAVSWAKAKHDEIITKVASTIIKAASGDIGGAMEKGQEVIEATKSVVSKSVSLFDKVVTAVKDTVDRIVKKVEDAAGGVIKWVKSLF